MIKEFKPGDTGVVFDAIINKATVGKTNGNNRSSYMNIVLQDESGTIDAKLWNATNEQIDCFIEGVVVEVKGDVIKYMDSRQMKIIKIKEISRDPKDQVKFLQTAPEDHQKMMNEISETIKEIKNENIHLIVAELFEENSESFELYPAATRNHHEYVSGLAYHTISMLRLAKAVCEIYPQLNKDLLYGGVILHDIGKTKELSGPIVPQYTVEGKLLGHISICQAMVKEKADELGIDGEEVILLQHMVLSHHGKQEFGSPVLPMIQEAEVLSFIDNMDARVNMFTKALDELEPGEFSKRIFALENRSIYKPKL